MNIIEQLEAEQVDKLAAERPVPEFGPGDTLRVNVKVVEGTRERVQALRRVHREAQFRRQQRVYCPQDQLW